MKKLIYIVIVLVAVGAVAFTLIGNKEEMKQTAAIAARTSEAIPVVLTEPKVTKIDQSFSVNGVFSPSQSLKLLSETQGQVVKIYKQKGDKVRAGEVLAQVEDDVLEANLINAKASFEKSKRDLERFEKLASGNAITERQLEEVRLGHENAQAQLITVRKRLEKARIVAPISGVINEKHIELGSFLNVGTSLFDIVNVDKLKFNAKVSERQVLLIEQGEHALVKADVMPEKAFEGIVTAIGAAGDKSLKYDVEIQVRNTSETTLRAGMYGTAFFEVPGARDALLIEREAIATSLQNPKVFVVKNQQAYLKEVTIGTISNNKVEIIKGLSSGEKVVLSGQINLKDGTKVSVL